MTTTTPRITRIHLVWHSWELKSVPRHELHPHTARWFITLMGDRFPDAHASIAFDGEPRKGADLTIEAHGGSYLEREALKLAAYDQIYKTVKAMMDCYISADAKHRAPFLVKPRADQLRYGVLQ